MGAQYKETLDSGHLGTIIGTNAAKESYFLKGITRFFSDLRCPYPASGSPGTGAVKLKVRAKCSEPETSQGPVKAHIIGKGPV